MMNRKKVMAEGTFLTDMKLFEGGHGKELGRGLVFPEDRADPKRRSRTTESCAGT